MRLPLKLAQGELVRLTRKYEHDNLNRFHYPPETGHVAYHDRDGRAVVRVGANDSIVDRVGARDA